MPNTAGTAVEPVGEWSNIETGAQSMQAALVDTDIRTRIRRVKCDETKPECKNCVSTGRVCDGYGPSTNILSRNLASKRPLLPASTSLLTSTPFSFLTFNTNADDKKAFHYFTQNLVVGLASVSPARDWISFALQLATTEPALYFAISAVGSAATTRIGISISHHTLVIPSRSNNAVAALEQYCKATTLLQKYINNAMSREASIEPIPLCCLLFVTYEMFQGKASLALAHLRLGKRAIEQSMYGNSSDGGESHIKSGRLRCLSLGFTREILSVLDWLASESPKCNQDTLKLRDDTQEHLGISLPISFPVSFATIEDAKGALGSIVEDTSRFRSTLLRLAEERVAKTKYSCSREALRFCIAHCLSRSIELHPTHSLPQQRTALLHCHEAWLTTLLNSQGLQNCVTRRSIVLMRIQQFFSSFMLRTSRDTRDDLMDHHEVHLHKVFGLIEEYVTATSTCPSDPKPHQQHLDNQIFGPRLHSSTSPSPSPSPPPEYQESQNTYMLEYAILPTLFLICQKCRSPPLRHQALNLLRTANRREGAQWSGEWAMYAESLITLEETLAAGQRPNGIVPEKARYMDVLIEDVAPSEVGMICARYRHESDGWLEVSEYRGCGPPSLRLQLSRTHVLEL